VGSVKHAVGGRRRESGVGHGGRRLAVGLIVAAIVVLVAAANASANSLSVKQVATGDVPQLRTQIGLHQLDSGALRSASGGASSVFPILLGPSSARAVGDIFYDGFEGAYPWQVSPIPLTWGGTPYRKAAGSESAYCAGRAIDAPGPYYNNMDARLWAGPIDLSAVTAAELTFKTYYQTEAGYDGVGVYVSVESGGLGYYYPAMSYSGSSGGAWVTKSVDLTSVPTLGNVCGASEVYVLFRFVSDATNTYEGAYVDEVRVSDTQVTPTAAITSLTPNHGQTGATVVIAGTNLGTSGTVRFGTTTATTSAWSATSVTCAVPASLASGAVNVTVTPTSGAASNALSFTVDAPSTLKPIDWTISGRPLTVRYNGTVTISGQLSDATSGAPLANRTVELHKTEDATTPIWLWDVFGNVDSAAGQFAVQVPGLQRGTYFFWWFNGDSQYDMGFSDQIKIKARAKLTPPAFGTSVRRGVLATKWGTLLPRHSAAANRRGHTKIEFSRYSNGKWRRVYVDEARSYRNTTSATKYSVRFRWPVKSKWRVRAIHEDPPDHVKTISSWRYFRVL
jgi:hypothetical protein